MGLSQSTRRGQRELGVGKAVGFACQQQNLHSCSIMLQPCGKQLNSCRTQRGVSPPPNVAGEIVPSLRPQLLIWLPEFLQGFGVVFVTPCCGVTPSPAPGSLVLSGPKCPARGGCPWGSGRRWGQGGCSARSPAPVRGLPLRVDDGAVLGNAGNPN